jgi:hypothetical protein
MAGSGTQFLPQVENKSDHYNTSSSKLQDPIGHLWDSSKVY